MRYVREAAGWLRQRDAADLALLLVALLALLAGWGFAEIAGEVLEGDAQAFDEWVLRVLRDPQDPARPRGPEWAVAVARDLTALGGQAVLGLGLLAIFGFLLLLRKRNMAFLVVAAGAGGVAANHLLKMFFARARPDLVPHLTEVNSPSFPSGHAMVSAAVYLSLAVLVARLLREWKVRVYVVAVAVLLTTVVGLTRIYLGVHYPTDVVAGWLAGGLWAVLCGLVARALQRRGKVETAGPEPDAGHAG